jgi:hypothetical protein
LNGRRSTDLHQGLRHAKAATEDPMRVGGGRTG